MKYYTATEACDTFPHLMPSDVWTLRRWIIAGKFPKHDCVIKNKQVWSEHTILNWQSIAKAAKS